jgi:hypothetical protein
MMVMFERRASRLIEDVRRPS